MKRPWPICASGWISMFVSAREARARNRADARQPRSERVWATRCASSACTPGHAARIWPEETPRAAGSRSCAAATSRRSSVATRRRMFTIRMLEVGTVRTVCPPCGADTQDVRGGEVQLEEAVGDGRRHAGEQLHRLERLERADHAGGRAEHAGV